MTLLTINLILLVVSVFKAPYLVKNFGKLAWGLALVDIIISWLIGLDGIQAAGDVETAVLAGGIKVSIIPLLYAAIINLVSIVADLVIKFKNNK